VADNHTIGDAPIESRFRRKMNALAATLDEWFNDTARGKDRKVGFVLLVFPFGEEGRCNYISNAERADVVTMLKEQIARFEGQPEPDQTTPH